MLWAVLTIFFFALIETPIFLLIAALTLAGLYAVSGDGTAFQLLLIEMNRLSSMPVLIALPLFTFVGTLLAETAAPKRIMRFMQAVLGWMPGGLAVASLVSCAFFTALTGASGVTIVALGSLLYPILRQHDYNENFSLGLLTTSGSLGLLFPPSLPVILYGVVAQVEISRIFKASLIPGILLIGLLSIYAVFHELRFRRVSSEVKKRKSGSTAKEFYSAFWGAAWDWPILVIILVGVYGGYATISEVATLVVIYVVTIECFVLREISFTRRLPELIVESTVLAGAIIIILAMSLGLTGYLVDIRVPDRILNFITGITSNKFVFLGCLNLFLLAVGCIMDIFSAIIIVVPIMVPVAQSFGIDPIHLCVIFLVNLEIGYSTPPVGINLFISSLKFEKPVTRLYRASLPYLGVLLIALLIITYVPVLSLFLIQ